MLRAGAAGGATVFSLPVRVYYQDTDAGGVVFHATYLDYCERARTEWLRSLGVAQGSAFKVNSITAGDQTGVSVAMSSTTGDFVVVGR